MQPSQFMPQMQSGQYAHPEFPGYDPSQRDIFSYFDGCRQVYGDPMAIRRRLESHLGNVDQVLGLCHAADWPGQGDVPADWVPSEAALMAAAQARCRLIEPVRDAFRMQPFQEESGQGALEHQCWEALIAYEQYLLKKKCSTPTGVI